jgi:uncharacterized protein (DUF58 family)
MKLSKKVLQKVKQIEIQTRRLLSGTQIGDYSSAQKGTGLEFDQIREYQMGDDVRFIDWNASARNNKILVKQYIEERNRTIMLLVDQSASTFYGSSDQLKSEVINQIASVLALVAECGKDHVGALLFADEVTQVIPPKRGRRHVHEIMERIFTQKPTGKTSLKNALERLIMLQKQDAIVFVISDFFDTGYEKVLKIASRQHDVVAVRCLDKREQTIPNCGFVPVLDPETGQEGMIDTQGKRLNQYLNDHQQQTVSTLRKCGTELLDVHVERPFVGDIIRFFRRRMMY